MFKTVGLHESLMEPEISLTECYNVILDSVRNDPNSFLVFGPAGWGLTELIRILKGECSKQNVEIIVSTLGPSGESQKYGLYISMLSALGVAATDHTPAGIERGISEAIASRKIPPVVVLENLNDATPESLDYFIYLSDLLRERKVPLIGTIRVSDFSNIMLRTFLREADLNGGILLTRLSRPELRDFSLVAGEYHYTLPDDFLSDVYSLCDGNISMLKYALSYYKRVGIIGPDNKLNEAAYRFLPVPPSPDDLYQTIIQALSTHEIYLLDAMLLFGGSISESDCTVVMGKSETEVKEILLRLSEQDIIYGDHAGYTFYSPQFSRYYASTVTSGQVSELMKRISTSPGYERFPLSTKLKLLLNSGNVNEAENILSAVGLRIADSFPTSESLLSFIREIEPSLKIPSVVRQIRYVKCKTLAELGRNDEALICFGDDEFTDIDPLEAKLLLSRLYLLKGDHGKCFDTVEAIINLARKDEPVYYKALLVRATDYLKEKKYSEARELAEKIVADTTKLNLWRIQGSANLIIGNISSEKAEYDKAEEYYMKVVDLCKTEKDMDLLTTCLNNMAIVSGYRGDLEAEISRYKSSIRTTFSTGNLRVRSYSIFNLMESYDNVGEYKEATAYIETEKNLISIIDDKYIEYLFLRLLAKRSMMAERFQDAASFAERMINVAMEVNLRQWVRMGEAFKMMAESCLSGVINDKLTDYFGDSPEFQEDFLPFYYLVGSGIFMLFNRDEYTEVCLRKLMDYSSVSKDYVGISLGLFARFYFYRYQKQSGIAVKLEELLADLSACKLPIVKAFGYVAEVLLSGDLSDHAEILDRLAEVNRKNSMLVEPLVVHAYVITEISVLKEMAGITYEESKILLKEIDGNPIINQLIEKKFGMV